MRKRLATFAAAIAVLTLVAAACNNSSTTTTPPASGGSPSGPSFTTITPGTLTVGSCLDYPPFEYKKNGVLTGFDVDMTYAIAAKLGFTQDQITWVKANFNTIFTAQQSGEFDVVAAAVTGTGAKGKQRSQRVAFSDFYYNSLQSLAVNGQATPDLTSTDQLKAGDSVGAQKGTTGLDWAIANLQPKGVTIKTYTAVTDAFRDLEGGNIQGIINDAPSSYAIVANFPGTMVVQTIDTNEKYVFTFQKENTALLAAWDQAQKAVIADGTYASIWAKYFKGPPPSEYQPTG